MGAAERCADLRNTNYAQVAVSIIIVLGILISYLPQHYRIISRGTSEGISPWFILLGTTSATAGFANILTVPPSRADLACCHELETFECLIGLLGIVQLGLQWACWALILVLFLVFFRSDHATVPAEELDEQQPKWQTAVIVALVCFLHGLAVIVVTVVLAIAWPNHLTPWANFLGATAAVSALVQYIPQIWITYRLKHIGSLSIPTMLIQTPGGLLFAASLFDRLGWTGWSSWSIFLVTAIMQAVLLSLAIHYELAARRARGAEHGYDNSGWNEPSPIPSDSDEQGSEPWQDDQPTPKRARHQPAKLRRAYSEGLLDGLPGAYTAHPGSYADSPEELEWLQQREELQADRETSPLLRQGGIGYPYRTNEETRQTEF